MAKFQVQGIKEYAKMLSRLEDRSEDIAKRAVYKGADVVADAIRSAITELPEHKGNEYGHKIRGVTPAQKQDILNGFGLAKMEEKDGYINTKAGFAGYGSEPTKKYPKGLPIPLLVNSINSGTSFRQKIPFIKRAVTASKKKAIEEMGRVIETEIKKEM